MSMQTDLTPSYTIKELMMDKKKGPYIPKWIKLPGGYTVKVNQIIPTKMLEVHGQVYDGIFDPNMMTLDINVRLGKGRKWYVYSQEVIHVVDAWAKWLQTMGIAER